MQFGRDFVSYLRVCFDIATQYAAQHAAVRRWYGTDSPRIRFAIKAHAPAHRRALALPTAWTRAPRPCSLAFSSDRRKWNLTSRPCKRRAPIIYRAKYVSRKMRFHATTRRMKRNDFSATAYIYRVSVILIRYIPPCKYYLHFYHTIRT